VCAPSRTAPRSPLSPYTTLFRSDAGLRHYVENNFNIYHSSKLGDAVTTVAFENRFHPVREYLDGLTWDGKPRLDTVLIDYLGAEDSEFVRTVTRKILTAGVARIYTPGCKMDYTLVLISGQGAKKSTFFSKLGKSWFSDSFTTVVGK